MTNLQARPGLGPGPRVGGSLGGHYHQTTYRHPNTTTFPTTGNAPTHQDLLGNYPTNCCEVDLRLLDQLLDTRGRNESYPGSYAYPSPYNSSTLTGWPTEVNWGSSVGTGYEFLAADLSPMILDTGLELFEGLPDDAADGFEIPATQVHEVEQWHATQFPTLSGQREQILLGSHHFGRFDEAFVPLAVRDNRHSQPPAISDGYSSRISNRSYDSGRSPDPTFSVDLLMLSPAQSTFRLRDESHQSQKTTRELSDGRSVDVPRNHRSSTTSNRIERRGRGRRTGRLSPEKRKKIHEVRNKGACLLCRLSKAPCDVSPGAAMCKKCENKSFSLGYGICIREHLTDYSQLLYPPLLKAHLDEAVVRRLTSIMQERFLQKYFEVELTSGVENTPLKIRVAEFTPRYDREASIPAIVRRTKDSSPDFVRLSPAPIAFRCQDIDNVFEECRKHVELVVKQQKLIASVAKDKVTRKLFKAISRYHCSASSTRNNDLLEKAAILSYIQYFLATTITYTAPSAKQVLDLMVRPNSGGWETAHISATLNQQIKSAMNKLFVELTEDVFQGLDKELRKRDPASWATCFSTVCVLLYCVELTQTAAHGFVMHKQMHQPVDNPPSINDGLEVCRRLEFKPVTHLTEYFHGVYYSRKSLEAKGAGRVCNPIRDQVGDSGLDKDSLALAIEVRKILNKNREFLNSRIKTPAYHQGYGSLHEHMLLREQNSGRLVANFLLSFKAFGNV